MDTSPRLARAVALLGAVVLVSGCLGVTPTGTQTPATSPTPTAAPTSSDRCIEGVSFWGLSGPAPEQRWSPDRVRIGYTVPQNTSVFFVVYENDTVLGYTHATNDDTGYPIASDGDPISLDSRLSGTHTIRVVVVADTNRNDAFDPGTDTACRDHGDVVQAGPRAIDFSAFVTTASESR